MERIVLSRCDICEYGKVVKSSLPCSHCCYNIKYKSFYKELEAVVKFRNALEISEDEVFKEDRCYESESEEDSQYC